MGTTLKLVIQEVSFGGRGVGRLPDGRVVFVPFVAVGETVQVEIVREHKSYLEARLVAVEERSPRRVEPACPYFGRCGGCSYQYLDAGEQLATKHAQVAGVLRRVGRFEEPVEVRPAVKSPREYGYRNRITVHVREGVVGFFAVGAGKGGRELVDIARCSIAEDGVNDALARFRSRPATRHREGNFTLRAAGADRAGEGFRQTNDGAATELLRLVADALPEGTAHLLDAYCGAGFFAKHLRDRFESVVGVEWDGRAVEAARRDAAPHERYECGDVAALLPGELSRLPATGSVLIVDPPSEGLAEPVRAAVAATPPAAMIYVSCNPATLARDLAALRTVYAIESVTPLDMFPQTAEIEVVARLKKRS